MLVFDTSAISATTADFTTLVKLHCSGRVLLCANCHTFSTNVQLDPFLWKLKWSNKVMPRLLDPCNSTVPQTCFDF